MQKPRRLLALLTLLFLAGCSAPPRTVVAGSACMGRVMSALAESYAAQGGAPPVEVQLGGSELGLLGLQSGVCDLASCSRALTPEEQQRLQSRVVALDAIAVAVHPSNPVRGLTAQQLRAVYSGEAQSWAELGGPPLPIVVIGREAGSGTRTAFEETLGIAAPRHAQEHCETGMLRAAVASCPGAVGYLSFDYLDESIRPLAIDGVLAGEQTVRSGRYPLTRQFLLCAPRDNITDEAEEFLRYACGDVGRAVVRLLGMLPP